MTKPFTFFWLDDDITRVENSGRAIVESGIAEVHFSADLTVIKIEKDAVQKLACYAEQIQTAQADLVVIDHVFNDSGILNTKGSSLAHLLRNALPNIPIVCVTATDIKRGAFDQETLSEYTHIFAFSKLSEDKEIELLYTIAQDFPKCVEFANNPAPEKLVSDLLRCPDIDSSSLEKVLPAEFKDNEQPTTPHRIARWIISSFVSLPGYLYDEMRLATLLGLSLEGASKIYGVFDEALYGGAFATKSRRRWWVSQVHRILGDHFLEESFESTQVAGRRLPGISTADYSSCWVDGVSEPPPDVVAFVDARGDEEVSVKSRYTKTFPADVTSSAGFEPRFVITKER